ncbi:MAG: acyl-ACP--UDP-N-acetylglucosamine O-acyltransferase [Pseudomonadota bacterium]
MAAVATVIHPTSVIEDGAQIGENVTIGPFCYVGSKAVVGDDVTMASHVVITGNTSIGTGTAIFNGAVLGGEPQNVRYKGEETELIIGASCVIREGVTMHTGMVDAGGKTIVGDHSMFLAYAHVAHDCRIGSHVILSNNVMLGGHVTIGDRVIIGGGAGVHQFCRVGHHAFVGGLATCVFDVIPFGMYNGNPGFLGGLNVVGMSRSGMDKAQIHVVRRVFKQLFHGKGTIRENLSEIRNDFNDNAAVTDIIEFIEADSHRGLATAARAKRG